MFFKDEHFILFDYSPTHSQLLFRSTRSSSNLDILVEGVFYFQSFLEFKDCEIVVGSRTDIKEFFELTGLETLDINQKLFVLKIGSKRFYIGAIRVLFQKNQLPPHETNISIKKEKPLDVNDILGIVESVRSGENKLEKIDNLWTELK